MNLVIQIGRAGRDPEVREFANGGRVAQFTFATNRRWRDRASGEMKTKTDWHRIRVYGGPTGGPVDRIVQYVRKGSRLRIMGELTSTTIINDRGERIPVTFVDVRSSDGVELLDPPRAREPVAPVEVLPKDTVESPMAPTEDEDILSDTALDELEDDGLSSLDEYT